MKKAFLTVAIIATMAIASTSAVSAQEPTQAPTEQSANEFAKIEASALPEAVTAAVVKEYEGSTIKEASGNKEAKLYQVVITTSNGSDVTVIYNENGEAQK